MKYRKCYKIAYVVLALLISLILIYAILRGDTSLLNLIKSEKYRMDNYWKIYMWITLCAGIILYKCRNYILDLKSDSVCFLIFFISIIIRGFTAIMHEWIPFSDFSFYYNAGGWIAEKNYSEVAAYCKAFKLPSFGGLAVLNSIIAHLFSHTLLGFRIGHSVLTSCIAVLVYKIGELFDKKVGLLASIIFAFYPSNIIMSQVTTNQHGACLMYLFAIYLILKWDTIELSIKQVLWRYAIIGGVLGIGYYFHPSASVMILALIFWFVTKFFFHERGDKKGKVLLKAALIILSYGIFVKVVMLCLLHAGIVSDTETLSMLSKFVVGLNQETSGMYSGEDYTLIAEAVNPTQVSIELIKERTKDIKSVFALFGHKIGVLLSGQDSSFWWYLMGNGDISQYESGSVEAILANADYMEMERKVSALGVWDQYYSFLVYIFVLLGVAYFARKGEISVEMQLLFWTMLGWMGVFIIGEVQPRYRYFIMPYLFICAAGGIKLLITILRKGKSLILKTLCLTNLKNENSDVDKENK